MAISPKHWFSKKASGKLKGRRTSLFVDPDKYIRDNLGVTVDNQRSPQAVTEEPPPTKFLAPWLFKAISLPGQYNKGTIQALRLLCTISSKRQESGFTKDYLVQFYSALHAGLTGTDPDVINTIIRYCGPQFFSSGLLGSSALLLDFLHAVDGLLSNDVKDAPKLEAASIISAMVCIPYVYGAEIPLLQPIYLDADKQRTELSSIPCRDLKDRIVNVLLKLIRQESASSARCVALSGLAMYAYAELTHGTFHKRMNEAIQTILSALKDVAVNYGRRDFAYDSVRQFSHHACSLLLLLCDHVDILSASISDVPRKIIEVLAMTIQNVLPKWGVSFTSEDRKLVVSMLFCLSEWCIRSPLSLLMKPAIDEPNTSLLYLVTKVLHTVSSGRWQTSGNSMNFLTASISAPITRSGSVVASDDNVPYTGSDFGANQLITKLAQLNASDDDSNGVSPALAKSESSGVVANADIFAIKLAGRTVLSHLMNHLGHFPMNCGAARITSVVCENDDVPGLLCDDLNTDIFDQPNVQFFVLNESSLVSLVELPTLEVPGGGVTAGLMTAKRQVRIIVRDLTGKTSWDTSVLYGPPSDNHRPKTGIVHQTESGYSSSYGELSPENVGASFNLKNPSPKSISPPRLTSRQRALNILPIHTNTDQDMDNLDDMLQYIAHTSPECVPIPDQPLNAPGPTVSVDKNLENDIITQILNQRNCEVDFNDGGSLYARNNSPCAKVLPGEALDVSTPFLFCRQYLSNMGLLCLDNKNSLELLNKSDKLIRELRYLDNQKCRETHKIAVIFVANGQEEKTAILNNSGGSQAFEEFVAGLGWEVELESHQGFMGGLQRNRSNGDTAPYYATSLLEIMFHVSTRMPTVTGDNGLQKMRHLGNDEIHIVWSEHTRDYRRGIIATDFCDVLIAIYPLPTARLYRIQISVKESMGYFGPLFDGAIVDHEVLPGLVRATALNASRAKRLHMPIYENFYEDRYKTLLKVVDEHKELTKCCEQFMSSVFSPVSNTANTGSRILTSAQRASDFTATSASGSSPVPFPAVSPNSGAVSSRKPSIGATLLSAGSLAAHSILDPALVVPSPQRRPSDSRSNFSAKSGNSTSEEFYCTSGGQLVPPAGQRKSLNHSTNSDSSTSTIGYEIPKTQPSPPSPPHRSKTHGRLHRYSLKSWSPNSSTESVPPPSPLQYQSKK